MARLVTLDVTNTCIRIASSPGYHYEKIGKEYGLELDIQQLDGAFRKAFKSYNVSHPCYGAKQGLSSKEWWNMVAMETYAQAGVKTKDLQEQLALRVYHDFKGPGNWEVYSDVEPALKILQTGAVLGAVSNFDERLDGILSGLGIRQYFKFVIASAEVKCAKPDPRIFEMALNSAGIAARDSIHVGDDYELDFLTAKTTGMKPLLLVRGDLVNKHIPKDTPIINSLVEVSSHLSF